MKKVFIAGGVLLVLLGIAVLLIAYNYRNDIHVNGEYRFQDGDLLLFGSIQYEKQSFYCKSIKKDNSCDGDRIVSVNGNGKQKEVLSIKDAIIFQAYIQNGMLDVFYAKSRKDELEYFMIRIDLSSMKILSEKAITLFPWGWNPISDEYTYSGSLVLEKDLRSNLLWEDTCVWYVDGNQIILQNATGERLAVANVNGEQSTSFKLLKNEKGLVVVDFSTNLTTVSQYAWKEKGILEKTSETNIMGEVFDVEALSDSILAFQGNYVLEIHDEQKNVLFEFREGTGVSSSIRKDDTLFLSAGNELWCISPGDKELRKFAVVDGEYCHFVSQQ